MHVRSPYPETLTELDRADAAQPGERGRRWLRRRRTGSRAAWPRRADATPAPPLPWGPATPAAVSPPAPGPLPDPTTPPPGPGPTSRAPNRHRWGSWSQRLLRFAWPPPPWQPLLAVAAFLTLLGGLGLAIGAHHGSVMPVPVVALDAVLALGFLPAGLIAVHRRPQRLAPMLIAMVGLLAVLALASAAWSGLFVGAWLAHWTWWPPVGLLPVVLLCFPTAPESQRARGWVDVAAFAAAAGTGCLMDAAAVSPNADLLEESRRIGVAATILTVGWLVAALVVAGTLLGALIRLLVLGRRGGQRARRATVCMLPAGAMVPVAAVLTWQGVPLAYLLPIPVLGVALALGLLPDPDGRGDGRWQRGLAAVLAAAGGYLLVTAGFVWLPRLAAAYPWLVPALGATLVVGIVAATARWWWRGVNALTSRLRYGADRPAYRTLRDRELPESTAPTATDITEAVTAALGAAGARILLDVGTGTVTVADTGGCTEPMTRFPIADDAGRQVGTLEVAMGTPERDLDEHEEATVRRALRRAAVAIAARESTWSADHARVAAVTRREEDRRWMRTELHDTFLPALSGCRGQLEAARLRMPSHRTAALLDPVIDELTDVSAAVRELMGQLRPDVLELGLAGAITQLARRRLPEADVRVDVTTEVTTDTRTHNTSDNSTDGAHEGGAARHDALTLVPAVEVAAYRIVAEALTGAALRGGVRTASVRVRVSARQVDLVVIDDGRDAAGRGPADDADTAVMRLAAEELGGRLSVISSAAGTRVSAVLPLPGLLDPTDRSGDELEDELNDELNDEHGDELGNERGNEADAETHVEAVAAGARVGS